MPRRWWFVGVSGSGKTSYARRLAELLDVPHHELDASYHQPHWEPLAPDLFRERAREFVAADGWTIDGNYRVVRSIVASRAQVVVGFDLPRPVVMRQIIARTLLRGVRGTELWNGNREQLRNALRWDEKSMIWWTWNYYYPHRERMDWLERIVTAEGIPFVRVHSHREARERLGQLAGVDPSHFLG